MKLFKCQACGQLVYFENRVCQRCARPLGYLPGETTMSALEAENGAWRALAAPGKLYRFCANANHDVCNWLIPVDQSEPFCLACRHNRTIPDLTDGENIARWLRLEVAKHRLFYTLLRFGLPLANRTDDPEHGLAFDFIAESPAHDAEKVLTGHDNGIITLALKEANDAERERQRQEMGETYRTPLGHFRHEIGHYFWDRLVMDEGRLNDFRACFGNEQQDYSEALRHHYANGPVANWQQSFVSAYASVHPWEDFAETWAHYLHIVDSLETAGAFGLRVHPGIDNAGELHADLNLEPHRARSIDQLVDAWLPVTFAVNSLNRSMGLPDLYPFILSPTVIGKLGMIHNLVHTRKNGTTRQG
jgi:hypothetical protein